MKQKSQNRIYFSWIFTLIFLTFSMLFLGCGAPGTSEEGIQIIDALDVPTQVVKFEVLTADGVLTHNKVQLVSMLKGVLGSEAITNDSGQATITINRQTIEDLNDNDLLYLYTESTINSSVLLDNFGANSKTLLKDQAKLRSFFGRASDTKGSIDFFKPILTTNPLLSKRAKINHFSNSKFIILEEQLKNANIISAPLTPNNLPNFSGSQLSQILNLHTAIETEIKRPSSDTAKKFLLISNATKAIIEDDLSSFILDSNNFPINQPLLILLELQESSGSTITNEFRSLLPSLSERISRDLTSELFSDSIPSDSAFELNAIVQNLKTVSVQDIEESIQIDLNIDPISSEDPIILSTTTLIHQVQFMTTKTSLQGASLRMNPTVVKARGKSIAGLIFSTTP
ncbi:MAG: hypothetical protein COB02_10245 [Candidatus Cloacimonadota bacterium]|nr:MAG: hypothetical protein COB02_10245 [Candidatus Cloacimonadota bacterium]